MNGLGRILIIGGLTMLLAGVVVTLGERFHIRPGRLPGDIVYHYGRNTTLYFPVATSILLSVVFSLVMWFLNRR